MPELAEFLEVFEAHTTVLGILCVLAALIGALLTRWVDRSALRSAQARAAAYREEVRVLNDARAELLAKVEERGDEVRRLKAALAEQNDATGATARRVPAGTGAGKLPVVEP